MVRSITAAKLCYHSFIYVGRSVWLEKNWKFLNYFCSQSHRTWVWGKWSQLKVRIVTLCVAACCFDDTVRRSKPKQGRIKILTIREDWLSRYENLHISDDVHQQTHIKFRYKFSKFRYKWKIQTLKIKIYYIFSCIYVIIKTYERFDSRVVHLIPLPPRKLFEPVRSYCQAMWRHTSSHSWAQ